MKNRYFFYIILLTTMLAGCNKDEKETVVLMRVDGETIWSYLGPPSPSGWPCELMRTKEISSGEIVRMGFTQIEGFNYEKGFEYLIKVKKTREEKVIMDAPYPYYYYSLVEIISKTGVDDGGIVVSLTVSAEIEWVNLVPGQLRPSPTFLLVKEEEAEDDDWERHPIYCIGNFNYEPGFDYILKVKKNCIEPLLQCKFGEINYNLDRAYWLLEVISKTEKPEIIEN